MRDPEGKPKEQNAAGDNYPPDEAARRAEASLKRLLSTPPKPQRMRAEPRRGKPAKRGAP